MIRWRRAIGIAVAALVFAGGLAIRLHRVSRAGSRTSWFARPQAALPADFHFTDDAARLGIHFVYRDPTLDPAFDGRERLLFWGSGAAVADVDGDGFMDILFVAARAGERNHLYLNRGGASFEEAAQSWNIADNDPDSAHTAATFFDYDNDGRPDLLLTGLRCTQLFHNTGASFEEVSGAASLRDCDNSMAAIPLDYDGDGRLDLYLLRYWNASDLMHVGDSRIWPENHFDARNGGRNELFRNDGDRFAKVTDTAGGGDPHWTLDAVWGDLDGSGQRALYLANDFGPDVLYGISAGRLVDHSGRLGMPDRRFGMGVSLGDLLGDGTPHVLVTNEYVDGYNQTGNFLWHFDRSGAAHDEARDRDVDDCGWAWGSVFADFDLDGREDLYVANGFISGESGRDLLGRYYAALRKDYAFTAATMRAAPGALAMEVKNWPRPGKFSYAGHQNDCLFWNRGDGFADVAAQVGMVEDADGRAAVVIDYDNNGALDLVVTTQNGAPHFYRNGLHPAGRFVGFTLVGTRSNRDGVGARVEVRQGARRFYRWATGGHTGFLASSDPRLHFGLPHAGAVDVTVSWPSGATQELRGLPSGQYHRIVEP